MNRIALFLACNLFCITAGAVEQIRDVPTAEDLLCFKTPHFQVIYEAPLEETAPLVAGYCEEAYEILTKVFDWKPEGRITVLYLDALDTHNGWATVIPHKVMAIYAAGSEPVSTIYQPGNYLRRTVFHEMAHLITMDMSFGYSKFFSDIFGRVLPFDLLSGIIFFLTTPPTVFVPRWVQEGISIWAETEYVPPGRGRSTYVDMYFRCAVLDNALLQFTKWYLEIPYWPYGQAAYLYGMKFFQHLREKDEAAPGELMSKFAHAVLFYIDPASREVTGKGLNSFAREMLKLEKERQFANLKHLRNLPVTETPRLTPKEISVYAPWCFQGKIYFLGQEEERRSTLYAYDPSADQLQKISDVRITPSSGNLAAAGNDRYLFYNRLEVVRGEQIWYEVRRFDPLHEDDELVTRDGRFRAIDVSPDGESIAAISQKAARSRMHELKLDADGALIESCELFSVPLPNEIASPRFDPAGARIVYVEAGEKGFALCVYHRDTGFLERIYETRHQILTPSWHPDKNRLIFSCDANGVYNLYEISAEAGAVPRALSHVTGGLFSPVFLPEGDRIAAVDFDGYGPFLTIVPYDPSRLNGKSLPDIAPSWKASSDLAYGQKPKAGEDDPFGAPLSENLTAPEAYNSFAHLRFDFWTPWAMPSANGLQGGVAASLSDPTGYQDLKLLAGGETRYNSPLAALLYTYRGFYPEITLYGAAEQNYYEDLLVQANTEYRYDYAEETGRFGLAVKVPLLRMERQVSSEVGYEFRLRNDIDRVSRRLTGLPISNPPTQEDEGLVWARLSYFDGTAFGRSSSIEDGRRVSMGAERSSSSLGGELSRARYLAEWNEYISMPGLKNHVLKISSAYGTGSGDRTAQGYFTLGGLADPISSLMPGIPSKLSIRGYPDNFQVGESVVRTAAAYRFPLLDFSTGYEGPVPIYSGRFFGELFYEGGRTWDPGSDGDDLKWINSMGVEANIAIKILRVLQFAPGIGVAYIPDRADRRDSDDRWISYISIKAWVNF